MRGESSGSVFLSSFDIQSVISLQTIGYGSYLESCTAGYAASVDIEATAPLQLEIDVTVDAVGKFEPILGCAESPGSAGRGVDELPLDYAGEEQLWVVYNNAMQPVSVSRGVVAFGSDESVVRLGIFDDNAVAIGMNGAGDTTVSGTVTATASTPTSGDYTFMQISRPFSSGSADFNGDGDVSPADEDLLAASLGATLSDAEYVAGIDYNLDGVISQVEVDRAQDLLDIALAVTACQADINNDGLINYFDFVAFTNFYNSADPAADINQDSVVNFNDFVGFLGLYNQPCQ